MSDKLDVEMDESTNTMIVNRLKDVVGWKEDVERDREKLRNAQIKVQAAELNLVDSVNFLEDAQASLYAIVRESFPMIR